MYCFKCKNIIMKKMAYFDVIVDMCEKCGGVWLDKNELSLIASNFVNKNIDINSKSYMTKMNIDIEKILEKRNVLTSPNQCSKCMNCTMEKVMWNGLELDICNKCNGIFFDSHEFPIAMNIYIKRKGILGRIWYFIKKRIFRKKERKI